LYEPEVFEDEDDFVYPDYDLVEGEDYVDSE